MHVPRGGILQAVLRQRVCLQYGDHDGSRLASDGDGGRGESKTLKDLRRERALFER